MMFNADKSFAKFIFTEGIAFFSFINVFILLFSIININAAPISVHKSSVAVPPAYALTFMKNFGYLDPGAPGVEAQYSQDSMSDAIKTVQKFGDIPQTGVFDNATLQLMQSPRCGIPDVDRNRNTRRKRYIIGARGWNKRNITYYIANWSPKIGEEAVVDEIERSFRAWSGYSRLNFKQINDPSADIIVAFGRGEHGDGHAFDGQGNILAHAFFPYELEAYGGDLHFDDDEPWVIRPNDSQDGTDFYSVAVHEIGHSLGLAHSPIPSSVMFPYYKGPNPDIQLDYDDILGLYQLYISRHLEDDTIPPRESSVSSTESSTTSEGNEIPNAGEETTIFETAADTTTLPTTADATTLRTTANTTPVRTTTETTTGKVYEVTYEGDWVTVDDHRRHQSEGFGDVITSTASTIPDICDGSYDAMSVFRTELFVFKGEYVWRLSKRGKIQAGYPVKLRQLFWQLPESVKRIDAAYQRDEDASIVLFSGKNYWVYNGYSFIDGSPRPLTDYGIDEAVDKLDAVQVWGKNKKLYLYRGEKFWRFNETSHTLDVGYPHNMRRWRGVPSHIDTAMTWIDGKTYFFKDTLFWKFDNFLVKTDDRYPLPAAQYWLGCPEKLDTVWW